MSRTTMTAAFAAMLAASMPMAFAQTAGNTTAPATNGSSAVIPPATQPSPPPATASANTGSTADHVMPDQFRFSKLKGTTVYGPDNKDIGSIDEVVLKNDGKVDVFVVKNGGFLGLGGKDVAVPPNQVKITPGDDGKLHVVVNMTEEQLKSAQNFDLSRPKNESTATGSSTPPAAAPSATTPPANHQK